jgi:hypothetical protein
VVAQPVFSVLERLGSISDKLKKGLAMKNMDYFLKEALFHWIAGNGVAFPFITLY